jgi:TonB family protein
MESRATNRLVIRIKLPAQEPAPPPARQPLNKLALALVLIPVVIALVWFGASTFGSKPESATQLATPAPAASEPAPVVNAPVVSAPAVSTGSPAQPAAAAADAPPSPVNEVLPAVSRGALNTVRGTIRVTIRVTLDQNGAVVAAAATESGPSRYFARHSLEAAKQWTFTPAKSAEPRTMLVRFYFKRSGVTTGADSP